MKTRTPKQLAAEASALKDMALTALDVYRCLMVALRTPHGSNRRALIRRAWRAADNVAKDFCDPTAEDVEMDAYEEVATGLNELDEASRAGRKLRAYCDRVEAESDAWAKDTMDDYCASRRKRTKKAPKVVRPVEKRCTSCNDKFEGYGEPRCHVCVGLDISEAEERCEELEREPLDVNDPAAILNAWAHCRARYDSEVDDLERKVERLSAKLEALGMHNAEKAIDAGKVATVYEKRDEPSKATSGETLHLGGSR